MSSLILTLKYLVSESGVNIVTISEGKGIDINISCEVENRINEILMRKESDTIFFPNILIKSGQPLFRNQSGMRGIQKKLALDLSSNDEKILSRMEK